MLPNNNQGSSYNFLTACHDDFPASSDNSFLLQNQQIIITSNQEPKLDTISADGSKKTCGRQRKVETKQGLRVPRVRLSVEVAHKFFELQDLLGFDKPSETVDWLINQSRVSIQQHFNMDIISDLLSDKRPEPNLQRKASKSKKERRKEARTRARERTMEKKMKMTMERDMVNVNVFSNETVDHSQDYLDGSYDNYLNSFCEHLNGVSFTPFQ